MTAVGGSSTMRNFPDVALTAYAVWVNYNHTTLAAQREWAEGTSIAAPLWTGFIALVNQQAASDGHPSVGFLNPALYAIAASTNYHSCFNDITIGNNTWIGSPGSPGSPDQYFAAPGYDLCTGLGSPKGTNLISALEYFSGPVYVDFNYTRGTQNGLYDTPFRTLAQATSAVPSGGTILFRTAGSSSETMTISKPMSFNAISGAATIGN